MPLHALDVKTVYRKAVYIHNTGDRHGSYCTKQFNNYGI